MGYNSTLVVMNDALGQIEKDQAFGASVVAAIQKIRSRDHYIAVPSGSYANAAAVIETHHSSTYVPVLVGANNGKVVEGVQVTWGMEDRERELELLKQLAEKLGYSLRKKK